MQMSDAILGLWAGTINDTSSVVAAGYAYGRAAGDLATIVKLSRALMIVPLASSLQAIAMSEISDRSKKSGFEKKFFLVYSWFVLVFLVSSLGIFHQI